MALVEFVNNSAPYLNAENLNNNFEYLENKIDNGEIYSTNEIKTNKVWINGKPIYRKVISISEAINQTNNVFAHGISNIEFIKIKEANVFNTSNGASYSLPIYLYNSHTATDALSVKVDFTNITFYMASAWNTQWQKTIVLEYTKTTD